MSPAAASQSDIETVTSDRILLRGSSNIFTRTLYVAHGATLRIEPGAKLAFASGTRLMVDGLLIARGSESAPIVFTSTTPSSTQGPGQWAGLFFGPEAQEGTTLENVVINQTGWLNTPAIEIKTLPRVVELANVTVRQEEHNPTHHLGLLAWSEPFAYLHNHLPSHRPFRGTPEAVAQIGLGNSFGSPVEVIGQRIVRALAWPQLPVPIWVRGTISIDGIGHTRARLAIPIASIIKFEPKASIEVGVSHDDGNGGALIARETVFTAMTSSAEPWGGIHIFPHADGSNVTGCIFSQTPIAIRIQDTIRDIHVSRNTFVSVEAAFAVGKEGRCSATEKWIDSSRILGGGRLCVTR